MSEKITERLRNTRAARRRHSTKIINEVDEHLASNEFDLAVLRSIQRLEKSADELAKANEALYAEMTDDEVLVDMDSVLEYEDQAAVSVGLLRHHIQKLAVQASGPSRSNGREEWPKHSTTNPTARKDDVKEDSEAGTATLYASSTSVHVVLDLSRYSWLRVLRVTAWILRFVAAYRARPIPQRRLTTEDLVASEKYWLSITQKERFGLELAALQTGRDLFKASTIRDWHPFLAKEDGLLRIQARLGNVVYHEGIKHPIVLPGDHIATELIATGLHRRLPHAGVATTIAELRECFWVTKVVMVRDDAVPEFCWKLAHVLKNITENDGTERACRLLADGKRLETVAGSSSLCAPPVGVCSGFGVGTLVPCHSFMAWCPRNGAAREGDLSCLEYVDGRSGYAATAVPSTRFLGVSNYFCSRLIALVCDGECDRYFLSRVVAFDRSAVDFPMLVINNAQEWSLYVVASTY
ncbi:hypothetical protein MTO96_048523 [Rhipicephalus appendiculatus]